MTPHTPQLRRLIFWNRFWLVLVVASSLIGGITYLAYRAVSDAKRLQVRWTDKSADADLILSSALGGPFMVTQLVTEGVGTPNTATAAIAQLPRPLFVRGPKAQTFITARELKQLVWVNSEEQKVPPPKPGTPVMVLYYETQKAITPR